MRDIEVKPTTVMVRTYTGTEAFVVHDAEGKVVFTSPAGQAPKTISVPESMFLKVGTDEEIAAEKVTQDALFAAIKAAAEKAKAAPVETGK
jgi:hypothetical protein